MTSTEEKITLEQMPQLLVELKGEILGIKEMVAALSGGENSTADQWMDLDAFRAYHSDINIPIGIPLGESVTVAIAQGTVSLGCEPSEEVWGMKRTRSRSGAAAERMRSGSEMEHTSVEDQASRFCPPLGDSGG